MTRNIIHLKEHRPRGRPFNNGPDPRRNMDGPPKGTNPLILLKKRALDKHTEDIIEIIEVVMNQAKHGNEKSQALVFSYFVTNILADLAADNCQDTFNFEDMNNIPKDVLEDMRANFVDVLSKYSNDDNKGDGE